MTADGCVGNDQPIKPVLQRAFDRIGDFAFIKVRRDLEKHRHIVIGRRLQRRASFSHGPKQITQGFARLQVTQTWRVGRRDVEREIAWLAPQALQPGNIVGGGVGTIFIGPDIGSDDGFAPARLTARTRHMVGKNL
jgi:hypothetical protein